MTRLMQRQLMNIDLFQYDQELRKKTGKNLEQLAWERSGLPRPLGDLQGERMAVIPVTAGHGLISGFSDTVSLVLRHLGLRSDVTCNHDIAGIGEAAANGATVLFCADDRLFLALDLRGGKYIDNARATAEMFMLAVEKMAGGLKGKKILIIGLGKVGVSCLNFALAKNESVHIHDIRPERSLEASQINNGVVVAGTLEKACREAEIVIDASSGEGFIPATWLRDDVIIGAPGIPLGLTNDAYHQFKDRLIHDPLPLGVAGMAAIILGTRNG